MAQSTVAGRNQVTSQVTKPAPLACLACRRKHQKCDARFPVCDRCCKTQTDCLYTPSRRGHRHTSKTQPPAARIDSSGSDRTAHESFNKSDRIQFADWTIPGALIAPESLDVRQLMALGDTSLSQDILPIHDPAPPRSGDDHLLDFYYSFFHDAHPILPPVHLLHRLAPIPTCLPAVLRFIGSQFASTLSSDVYRARATAAIAEQTEPTFHKVQALLLFSIALHGRNERVEALEFFRLAVDLALKLGMNQMLFAQQFGGNDPVREESLRRTWWELYIIDGLFAAFDQCSFRIDDCEVDVGLPCEEFTYSAGVVNSQPPTASQFFDRFFADEDTEYSSFCYAIEAARILKRALALGHSFDDRHREQIESIDASITSWFHHLPQVKANVMGPDGGVDQMLFQAFLVIHCASICLHLPRSNLLSTPVARASIACAPRALSSASTTSHITHAVNAIKAANGLSALASLRAPVIKHTPFFICGLVLSAVVQLSACSVKATGYLEPRRDRIVLIIGELKSLGPTWAISRRVMQHIKAVAREVLEIGIRPPPYPEALDCCPDVRSIIDNDLWLGDILSEY